MYSIRNIHNIYLGNQNNSGRPTALQLLDGRGLTVTALLQDIDLDNGPLVGLHASRFW